MNSSLSYVHGTSDSPFIGETIGRYFDAACERYADREALVAFKDGVRLTYSELRCRVDELACGLIRLGLKPGERIGIWSPNRVEWTLIQFATAKAGLILVNINPAYRLSELQFALNLVGCRALVTTGNSKSRDYLSRLVPELASDGLGELQSVRVPKLQFVIRFGLKSTTGMLNFASLLTTPSKDEKAFLKSLGERLQFDDPINIQFTSGTTGSPRGATLSHHNVLNNGFFVGEGIRLVPGDRICIPVPLYHCFGMVMGNIGALTHGAAVIYPSEAFDALTTLKAVAAERCTVLYGVPTMFIAQLDHPSFASHDLSCLRTGIMAGSPCPVEVMRAVIDRMHLGAITIAYGMTETSPVSFQTAVDDPIECRVSTVGRVHPYCEVKIIDRDGHIVPRGVAGELCTRGYSVMLGYWGDQAKTSEAIDSAGWMHTGDLATIDHAGYCRIVGRIRDVVIRGGENIYPREIEEFLYSHPAIADVQVVGVPDAKYGEELCAWIILRIGISSTEDEIRKYCRGQIAQYKIPKFIRFVDSFPMTVTGKVQKYLIRAAMLKDISAVV